ncbi:unnamed protein product [Hermetia illucens]|uniref:Protein sleepless n=1 Tax=Hermetia illucens TaxID=343691 RepID=A0A7R8UIL2_HERIL|nr:uncharacterized protein LOC119648130 [Hermetia illucens]CAD7081340.1 unnamed protein product [Hermetia illucens]
MAGVGSCLLIICILSIAINHCSAIWCYRCTSATPGCAEKFNWRGIGYWGEQCPEDNDICVKVIERRGAQQTIIRDCLSALRGPRTDIPPDHYEGCRPAGKDVRLGHYVNNTIKELDVHRDYYNDVTFCFCFLDHRCNGADSLQYRSLLVPLTTIAIVLSLYKFTRL